MIDKCCQSVSLFNFKGKKYSLQFERIRSRSIGIKKDHEVVAAEDELEGFWWSAIFQGSPDKIIYDGHSLFDLESLQKFKAKL